MSQKISVPVINITPKQIDVTSTPAFQQQMADLQTASANAVTAIKDGKAIAAAVTARASNPPKFELDPETKQNLASCKAACATISANMRDAQGALEKELSRTASKPATSPAAQAALDRISAGFAHIEAVRKATQLPALKVNA